MSPSSSLPSLTPLSRDLADGHPEPYAHLRKDLLTILDAALGAVQPGPLLREVLQDDGTLVLGDERYELGNGEDVAVLATGRGAAGFAQAASKILPEARGLVVAPEEGKAGDWDWHVAAHPVPDEGSIEAGEAALAFAESVGPDERLLVLITGGASAMMEVPEIPLEDLQMATQTMLARGLTIHETNILRKHISKIKGGRLAQACKGEIITVALSDVHKDRPSDVGSGPTVPDPTTFSQAKAVIERVGEDNFPPVLVDHIDAGAAGKMPETPKPSELDTGTFHVLASVRDAITAAEEMSRELGYRPTTLPTLLEGESRVMGESLARRLVSEGNALIGGGETTVTLRPTHEGGPGKGGRCQELALAAALDLEGTEAVVGVFATDGVDGPTDAAGAIADGRTMTRAREAGLDAKEHLTSNDAYPFFEALDDLIVTGSTGTNVMDLFVGLVAEDT